MVEAYLNHHGCSSCGPITCLIMTFLFSCKQILFSRRDYSVASGHRSVKDKVGYLRPKVTRCVYKGKVYIVGIKRFIVFYGDDLDDWKSMFTM